MSAIEWRIPPGFPRYEVSNTGDVRCISSREKKKLGRLKKSTNAGGYLWVQIAHESGLSGKINVHKLVAFTFIGPPPFVDALVRHMDGNKLNNSAINLMYGTSKDNAQDAVKHGTVSHGESCHWSKLTELDVMRIKKLCSEKKMSQTEIGKLFGVTQSAVHLIVSGKKWKHLGDAVADRNTSGPRSTSAETVKAIREARAAGRKLQEVAADVGMSASNVSFISRGSTHKSAGGPLTKREEKSNGN